MRFFRQPLDDVLACLEPIATARSPWMAALPLVIVLIVAWHIYVPIHELLHAYGCHITGGHIGQLDISPRYGGTWLETKFDFVSSGSRYAGQLSDFNINDSDFCYFVTCFLPFVLTIVIGVPLIKLAGRGGRRPVIFALGIVLGLAPFYNMQGDYYEMGSILVTRLVTFGPGHPPAFEGIRSDDIFQLWTDIFVRPAELGLHGAGQIILGGLLVLVSMVVDVLLAFATYYAGHLFSLLWFRKPTPATAQPA